MHKIWQVKSQMQLTIIASSVGGCDWL